MMSGSLGWFLGGMESEGETRPGIEAGESTVSCGADGGSEGEAGAEGDAVSEAWCAAISSVEAGMVSGDVGASEGSRW